MKQILRTFSVILLAVAFASCEEAAVEEKVSIDGPETRVFTSYPGKIGPAEQTIHPNQWPKPLLSVELAGEWIPELDSNGLYWFVYHTFSDDYIWQSCRDKTDWRTISGATGPDFSPSPPSTTTYYRRCYMFGSLECTDPVAIYTIEIYNPDAGGGGPGSPGYPITTHP